MTGIRRNRGSLEEDLANSLRHEGSSERLAMPTHLAGEHLGSFRLVKVLGMGAMGVVYLAVDRDLGREVAIKLMPPGSADTGEKRRARFLREARTAAQLVHPHVVQIFQVGEALGLPYIAMEYVDGVTAEAAARAAGGRMAEQTAMCRMREAADALAMAESLGICHRDIKPANLMISSAGALKIADFGLASRSKVTESIGPGSALEGTPLYMSPEQWAGAKSAAPCDIYSLGCTFYHLVVGCTPFAVRDLIGCFHAHREAPVPDPRALMPELDADLAALLMRCMAKRPEDRPRAGEIVELLQDALAVRRSTSRSRGVPASSAGQRGPDTPPSVPSSGERGVEPPSVPSSGQRAPEPSPSQGIPPSSRRGGGPPSYLDLFGLETYPFNDLRQPSFFWTGGPYGEAVTALASQIARGQRPALLVGQPGSGRTFAAEMLRYQARSMHTYAIQPQLLIGVRPVEWLCRQIGVPVAPGAGQRDLLAGFLAAALPEGSPETVATVILDEVDTDDREQLEDLGELLDGPLASPRLAVLLVGPADLPARLAAAGAPAGWSAAAPVSIRGMTADEMRQYIDFRMTSIGGNTMGLPLDVACQQLLHARSKGLPSLVNVFCHNALVLAALQNQSAVQMETLRLAMKSKTYLSSAAASLLFDDW